MPRKVELGEYTEDDLIDLLWMVLDELPEASALVAIRQWLEDNELNDEI